MDPNISIHLYRPDSDLPALTELVNAIEGASYTPEQVQARINWPGHNLARDRYVAARFDQLVGMSMLIPQSVSRFFVEASVHPDFRRQGIGRALIDQVVDDACQRGAQQVTGAVEAHNQAAAFFAQACGFASAGEVRFFTGPAGLSLPEAQLPEGFVLKQGSDFSNLQIFADACNNCYQDMWGHYENLQPLTLDKIAEWNQRNPQIFALEHLFVIFSPDGAPVGVTRVLQEGEGDQAARVIDAPGVAPAYRYLALQRPLVTAAANWLKAHAVGRYEIQTWGDTLEAVQLYEQMGFQLDEANHSIEFVKFLA